MSRDRFVKVYGHYFPEEFRNLPAHQDEVPVQAFCHDDNRQSMSINLKTGTWYCFACDHGDDEIQFIKDYESEVNNRKMSFPQAKARADELAGGEARGDRTPKQDTEPQERPKVNDKGIQLWHKMFMDEEGLTTELTNRRGLTKDTMRKYKIGHDLNDRYYIPIYNTDGECINVRKYKLDPEETEAKMLSWGKGYGGAYVYPVENLLECQEIFLCEGEMDALLANQLGFNGVTLTGGANATLEPFKELFEGKDLIICYDVDSAGKIGANKVAKLMKDICNSIKILHLPITDIKNGDFTDFIMKMGNIAHDVTKLIQATPFYGSVEAKPKVEESSTDGNDVVPLHLSNNSEYHGKRIKLDVMVVGKDTTPFKVPKTVEVRCSPDEKKCAMCPMYDYGEGGFEFSIPQTCREVLAMFNVDDGKMNRTLREVCGIKKTCAICDIDVLEYWGIEELTLAPNIDSNNGESKHMLMNVYAIEQRDIESNKSYIFSAIPASSPKDQRATHIVYDNEPAQSNIDSFTMTPEILERLKMFQVDERGVKAKFNDIYEDLERNVTRVRGRRDVHIGADLVYHSALEWKLESREERRGWVEGLIVGDTRTGKSEAVTRLHEHYAMGDFVTAENTSFAGLVGGMQQNNKRWFISWGKLPQNNRRMVIIDEMSGLEVNDIANMSGIRSSGVAEITKIHTEKTNAKTRLLWISNDRKGVGLSGYSNGTEAIQELVGKNEDISRFEFVVTAERSEVSMDTINKRETELAPVPHVYTTGLCQELITWVWSRKMENIVFEPATIDLIYSKAREMGDTYTSEVPLVESANQRVKIARMSVATACRVFSTTDGENVIVKPEHVEFACQFLDFVFSKKSLGYKDLSTLAKRKEVEYERNKQAINRIIGMNERMATVFEKSITFQDKDLALMLCVDSQTARTYMSDLCKYGMLEKERYGWKVTPELSKLSKEYSMDKARED